jgi:hypothetical protein
MEISRWEDDFGAGEKRFGCGEGAEDAGREGCL